ncbi:MAG: NAD(P)/FAD-dependent oxidoreductase [Candidatus Sericytochromatia bacterium]|nr:NAD(P)/FAD-dependent oxidoreductase [Candidatus Sericytochromatia bacterium]
MAGTSGSPVLIVGAGMAGISAALWCQRVQLPLRWIEASPTVGGQLVRIHGSIPDYAGLPAPNGRAFLAQLQAHLAAQGLAPEPEVALVEVRDEGTRVGLSTGEVLEPAAVVLATGARPRRLGVEGEERLRGAGVSDSATRDLQALRGQAVAVVGGGDAALENALILAEVCPRVCLLHRGVAFRGRPAFQAAIAAHPRIEVRLETRVTAVLGKDAVMALAVAGPAGPEHLAVTAVVVKVGIAPALGPFSGLLAVDEAGYVRVDAQQRTSLPQVWAAGDVCNPLASSLAAAGGQAAIAIKAIERALADERRGREKGRQPASG